MASTLPVFNDVQNYTGTLQYLTSSTIAVLDGWFKVADLTALRALATDSDNKFAVVDDINGFGSGAYRWDNTSTAADDDATIIAPSDAGTGRWIRLV
jgi:hypothetical protein